MPWPGPHGGLPPFDQVKLEHFRPALEQAMAQTLTALDKIAANPQAPSFENTFAPLERAFRTYSRVRAVFGVWSGALNTPEFQAVEREMTPKLAAFHDKITQHGPLFGRIEKVYKTEGRAGQTPEQKRLEWKTWDDFVRAGARLDTKAKARLSAINQQLATLFTRFGQNVLADETDQFLVLESEADLAGLPQSLKDAAASEAASRKLPGKWVIRNTRSSIDPFLTYSGRRDLREKAWRLFVGRGDGGGKTDNKATITEILRLRVERAKLLGHPTHAHLRLQNTMAKTPEAALKLLEAVWKPAKARVRQEVADMQAIANREKPRIKIEPWDYRFYAEKVRKKKYALDEGQIKPYLQLDKLREAMFWVAGELYGLSFGLIEGVPVFHPDVTVWLVSDQATQKPVGVFYFDPFARSGKRSGAWMSAYRSQERLDGEVLPIVSNNCNFLRGKPGEAVLVSWDDARTLFHEFGHALHGLLSNVTYSSLAGTAVFRDYVELPSQLNEHWLPTPEVLSRFALHYQTGKPIPKALVQKIERAATFNQGFDTVEYLASAFIDMKAHLFTDERIDPAAFERDTLAALGMPKEIVMRHRTPQFLHVFSGDSYSAGYYSYLWADVLTADAFEAFKRAKGPYDKVVAKRLRDHVLSVGNTIDPAEGYRRFRGKDATVAPLMRKRGFPVPKGL
ncbi:MAG: M3 family metallopeptidase [Polyangia bacterium]|nr:M3 family metallopeptidase [Polyangia bacterium]